MSPRVAIRPLAIVGLGYILSYWGGAEIALRSEDGSSQ